MEYFLHLIILICFYTLLAQSLNLSAGFTGLVSLAHSGFLGIGAYTAAILSTHYHVSFWVNIPIAMLIGGVIAVLVAPIALRTVDDYFVICTLGIQIILNALMNNLMPLTNGPLGIANIPSVHFFGIVIHNKLIFLLIAGALMAMVWYLLGNLARSGFGKTLIAISEDEIYVQSIGKNVYQAKIVSFTTSATLATIPGVLYAHYLSYIDPTNFTLGESIFILSIVIMGGLGNLLGSFFAATFLVLLPEGLRFVGMPDGIAANMRQIIYGVILVVVMMGREK